MSPLREGRIRAGRLRHTVTIQEPSESRDAKGDPSTSWSNVATRSASVEPMGGSERFAARQHYGTTPYTVRMRYTEGVTPKMRLLWRREHTTLATGVNDAATQLEVADDAGTRSAEPGNVRVQVGDELMVMTDGHGTTTWTVERGADGTSAATHAAGADVYRLHALDIQAAGDPTGRRSMLRLEATEVE